MPELLVTSRAAPRPTDNFMAETEMEALVYLCASRSPVTPEAIGRDLSRPGDKDTRPARRRRGHDIIRRLGFAGLLHCDGRHTIGFELTERGKIAAAFVMFKRPALKRAYFDE